MIDFICRTGSNYYPQVFLKECKYVVEEKRRPEYITDNIEISSDSYRVESDEEVLMKKILMKKFLMKKIELGKGSKKISIFS